MIDWLRTGRRAARCRVDRVNFLLEYVRTLESDLLHASVFGICARRVSVGVHASDGRTAPCSSRSDGHQFSARLGAAGKGAPVGHDIEGMLILGGLPERRVRRPMMCWASLPMIGRVPSGETLTSVLSGCVVMKSDPSGAMAKPSPECLAPPALPCRNGPRRPSNSAAPWSGRRPSHTCPCPGSEVRSHRARGRCLDARTARDRSAPFATS